MFSISLLLLHSKFGLESELMTHVLMLVVLYPVDTKTMFHTMVKQLGFHGLQDLHGKAPTALMLTKQ